MALFTYPSNKLEYLVTVLSKLLECNASNKSILEPNEILVGSRGMQHWLSMELAQKQSIAMNINFEMVNSFVINTASDITNTTDSKKAYSQDILTWRIFSIISSDDFIAKEINAKINNYWIIDNKKNQLKCYQLAVKISEVFSQYIRFRPEWLNKWQANESISQETTDDESWQKGLWQELVNQEPNTPISIQAKALKELKNYNKLAKDIYIFGINAISPTNLNFLFELAKLTNVHILYVNPCSEYWMDFKKSKIAAWLGEDDYEAQPLLSNLGQQGKEFFNQILVNDTKDELAIYDKLSDFSFDEVSQSSQTLLNSIQTNLLNLDDNNNSKETDISSVVINSCHSPLRELQVLHDSLLDLFEANKELDPKDILVMCPNIEDYAPYINTVFTKGYEKDDKRLPCSIADRTLKNSEPLVSSFMDMLDLPDSKFEVTKILDFLSVPAIQNKFNIENDNLETIEYWLRESCIHRMLGDKDTKYSWNWGLNRLLLGFCISDKPEIILNETLMSLPNIQGKEISALGSLYELLELLSGFAAELSKPKTIKQWQDELTKNMTDLFEVKEEDKRVEKSITKTIAKLVTSVEAADYPDDYRFELSTIRYFLNKHFSEPEINNHFLKGKITFCSMTPMRSIPFKVVAMLGLNSGKFPRQDQPISFDLMASNPRIQGDTTKRDNDRYLFLETLISAREYLYLSYMGKSVRNNATQESSLILKEFMSYLEANYGIKADDFIKQNPLHPFSKECYIKGSKFQSYDTKWLELLKKEPKLFAENTIDKGIDNDEAPRLDKNLTVKKLVDIFDDPLKAYCNKSLELYFSRDEDEISDSEPFDVGRLEKYALKGDISSLLLKGEQDFSQIETKNMLTGKLPDSPLSQQAIAEQIEPMQQLAETVKNQSHESYMVHVGEHSLEASGYVDNDGKLSIFTISTIKEKDRLKLYLTALIKAMKTDKAVEDAELSYIKDNSLKSISISSSITPKFAKNELERYIDKANEIITSNKLSHLNLAKAVHNKKGWDEEIISSEFKFDALEDNDYFNLFYSTKPTKDQFDDLGKLYDGLNESVEAIN